VRLDRTFHLKSDQVRKQLLVRGHSMGHLYVVPYLQDNEWILCMSHTTSSKTSGLDETPQCQFTWNYFRQRNESFVANVWTKYFQGAV